MAIETINPATGELIKRFEEFSEEKVNEIIEKSHEKFLSWKKTSFNERKNLMLNAAKVLRDRKEEWAKIMTLEMGKAISQSLAEVEKCAWVCEYYAENAEKMLSKEFMKQIVHKVMSVLTLLELYFLLCRGIFLFGKCLDLRHPL